MGDLTLRIRPTPPRTYTRSDSVFLYMEIYNLSKDAFGQTRFEIAYHLDRQDPDEVDPRLFEAYDLTNSPGTLSVCRIVRSTSEELLPGEVRDSVDYVVTYVPSKRNRVDEQTRRRRLEGGRFETSVTTEYQGSSRDDFTYLQIDISNVPPAFTNSPSRFER